MRIKLFQVDAFADRVFSGNPAAVCPLETWLPEATMQAIAAENNLSETAFFVPAGDGYAIRWFTPSREVKLCGHATLACAHVLFEDLGFQGEHINFTSKSGLLTVQRDGGLLVLDFPAQPPKPCTVPAEIHAALEATPEQCLKGEDYIVVFASHREVEAAAPDLPMLSRLDARGVVLTAMAERYDFVARFFAPRYGIAEDPVTGSAYTQLVPYWANRLGKSRFKARQVSRRGGDLRLELKGNRVLIAGRAVKYLEGEIEVPAA